MKSLFFRIPVHLTQFNRTQSNYFLSSAETQQKEKSCYLKAECHKPLLNYLRLFTVIPVKELPNNRSQNLVMRLCSCVFGICILQLSNNRPYIWLQVSVGSLSFIGSPTQNIKELNQRPAVINQAHNKQRAQIRHSVKHSHFICVRPGPFIRSTNSCVSSTVSPLQRPQLLAEHQRKPTC